MLLCAGSNQQNGWEGGDSVLPKERGVGFWNLGQKFVEAGDKLQPPISTLAFFPLFLLYGHGIELGLKAFLISQGATEKELRDIGHDLTRALDAARAHPSFEPLREKDLQVIDLLNPYYQGKEFEYIVPGAKQWPQAGDLSSVAHRLLAVLRPIIWKAVQTHRDQGKTPAKPAADQGSSSDV